jgi:hypothetical protein
LVGVIILDAIAADARPVTLDLENVRQVVCDDSRDVLNRDASSIPEIRRKLPAARSVSKRPHSTREPEGRRDSRA